MKLIFTLSMLILMICSMILLINNLISKKSFYDREKSSPFECGFDPMTSARLPFSLHFFLIALIFLIFDVEITLILPFIKTLIYSNLLNYFIIMMFFIIILLTGIYHEWQQGALNWIK